jgi:hypothetical protein
MLKILTSFTNYSLINFTFGSLASRFRGNSMIQDNFEQNQQLDKIFKQEQFQKIIKAIILGKYAWACVLFLDFSGCDPLDYIPYETYTKLIEDNYIFTGDNPSQNHEQKLNQSNKKLKITGLKLTWIKLTRSQVKLKN